MMKTILLVEDEAPVRRLVEDILSRSEIKVLVAESAEEGIRIAKGFRHPIHLLVVNAILPGMLGTQVASVIKVSRPSIRVILLTGKASDLSVMNGGWQLLKKALVGSDLMACVNAALRASSSKRRLVGGAGGC